MFELIKDECGQGTLEYALIISIVSIASIGLLILIGNKVYNNYYNRIENMIN